MLSALRSLRSDEDREDVISRAGRVFFNFLQQRPAECDEDCELDLITTDPLGITDAPTTGS